MEGTGKTVIIFKLLFLFGWIFLIFLFSSQSYEEQSIIPFLSKHFSERAATEVLPDMDFYYFHHEYSNAKKPFDLIEFLFRKGAHLFIYAVLAFLAATALRAGDKPRYWLLVPLLVAVSVAKVDEWNQSFTVGRTSNPKDILIDAIGGVMGLGCYIILRKLRLGNRNEKR
ncbi:VanZ family protein [Paenibacillus glycinis]|uniref:VanZ family protein n=1 Tax=Paenibacillus glycinis TaxID=2697035 RepID=A0ABW9XLT5_9BACL|nr:VanZ family protein [Paenibacillus glycinis]NBD23590.1 VanZ family protein [Paenibacillus glycinis]